jgi:hypothetical protein
MPDQHTSSQHAPVFLQKPSLFFRTDSTPLLLTSAVTALPDYERCVAGAPLNREGNGPGRSMVDFVWCTMAAQRGWSIEDTADKLLEVSARALGARTTP